MNNLVFSEIIVAGSFVWSKFLGWQFPRSLYVLIPQNEPYFLITILWLATKTHTKQSLAAAYTNTGVIAADM